MYSDADAAALYDLTNPWDGKRFPSDAFYDGLVMGADSVLDVGCGTGSMLHHARECGHVGRLVGLDPDSAALDRARARARFQVQAQAQSSARTHVRTIEWVHGRAAQAHWDREFALATMVSHAFQCLVGDDELRESLAAIRAALREGGRFAFETRHPQARAWESWNPSNVSELVDAAGRYVRTWYEVESVVDDVVTFTGTVADQSGNELRRDRTSLRFLDLPTLERFLAEAGFVVEACYGDWHRGPITEASTEIILIARRE